ncbi:MAG: M48 family metallopeptidase [Robiginitomaculum sp.]|nr:M48 family metallopeptidase [Robiginitomaculum sp.]
MKKYFFVIMVLILGACATPNTSPPGITSIMEAEEAQRQFAYTLDRRRSEALRLQKIGNQVLAANADFCPNTRQLFGVWLHTSHDYNRNIRSAAEIHYNINEEPSIYFVVPGSAADIAGLQQGDTLISIDSQPTTSGKQATKKITAQLKKLVEADEIRPISFEVMRDEDPLSIAITPQIICGYPLSLADSDSINAYANGKGIFVTRGMMRFAESDEELALIISHELAHNTEGHVEAKMRNTIVGGIGGLAIDILFAAGGVNTGGAFTDAGMDIGQVAYSEAFEAEADYVGTYFLHRTGMDTVNVAHFWRKMAAENPRSITAVTTHPTSTSRFLRIRAAIKEIEDKQSGGQKIVPNLVSK